MPTPAEHLSEARRIAAQNGMFVVERGSALLLYRRTHQRPALLGQRASARDFRYLVQRCATTTNP